MQYLYLSFIDYYEDTKLGPYWVTKTRDFALIDLFVYQLLKRHLIQIFNFVWNFEVRKI